MDPWIALGIFLLGAGAGALTKVALYLKQIRQLKDVLEAAHNNSRTEEQCRAPSLGGLAPVRFAHRVRQLCRQRDLDRQQPHSIRDSAARRMPVEIKNEVFERETLMQKRSSPICGHWHSSQTTQSPDGIRLLPPFGILVCETQFYFATAVANVQGRESPSEKVFC